MMKTESIAEKVVDFAWRGIFEGARRHVAHSAVAAGLCPFSIIGTALPSLLESTSSAKPKAVELTMNGIERLRHAAFVPPSTIELDFVDGRRRLNAEQLGMPMDRIDWPTLRASPGGEKVVVKGIKGDPVPIDSATLRYLVDEKYAAKMDEKLKALQLTDEELEQLDLNEPPPGFLEQADIDLTRESWK